MSPRPRTNRVTGEPHTHGGTPVVLEFRHEPGAEDAPHRDLSAVVQVGRDLWLGSDEGAALERLSPVGADRWGRHATIDLHAVLDLPNARDEEIDVEALAAADGWLWVVGSHSVKRKKPRPDDPPEAQMARLARVVREGNRHLLARLPLVPEPAAEPAGGNGAAPAAAPADGNGAAAPDPSARGAPSMTVVREATGAAGVSTRVAARLHGGRRSGALGAALADDAHLASYLAIPSKENGLDVEGLAVGGGRVWLGLRGPVLRGWAVILALTPEVDDDASDRLRLGRSGPQRRRYEKFFLDLHGLGVRELCAAGEDLLILAGPTMQLDGRALVVRWRGALAERGDRMVPESRLERVLELPYGHGLEESVDHPEGMTLLDDGGEPSLLVVFDTPAAYRARGQAAVTAERFPLR